MKRHQFQKMRWSLHCQKEERDFQSVC
uniref:Uncharacterized protein n=1 Tax=Anguilla anguilla TaxID=7936 RepID=A0A0E9PT26_ANGAN